MNKLSIEKLRRKLIYTTTFSFAIVMLLMALLIYGTNRLSTSRMKWLQLRSIVDNGGIYPSDVAAIEEDAEDDQEKRHPDDSEESPTESHTEEPTYHSPSLQDLLFPGTGSLTRLYGRSQSDVHYFTVYYNDEGKCTGTYLNDLYIDTAKEARELSDKVLNSFWKYGRQSHYYYMIGPSDDGYMVVFLDSSELIASDNRLFYTAVLLFFFGFMITFLLVHLFSHRLVQSEIENSERQKQFITNASHELKTPLAVIRANTEVEQMLHGEDEWNTSTMRQIDRLTALIENLVLISRAEEQDLERELLSAVNVTKAVTETSETFRTVATQDGKTLDLSIAQDVTLLCEDGDIRQLSSLLIDNAIKYCDEGGTIQVTLLKKAKAVHLSVSNSFAAGAGIDYDRFFDRFYRQDEAHTNGREKGGFGIGLSIAESLIAKYHGKISVTWKDGVITFHCLLKGVL